MCGNNIGFKPTVDVCWTVKFSVLTIHRFFIQNLGNTFTVGTMQSGKHVATYENCQTACESLWAWRAFLHCILKMDEAQAHSYAPELQRHLSGIAKDHHAHENVDRKRVSWNVNCGIWVWGCSFHTLCHSLHCIIRTAAVTFCVTWQCLILYSLYNDWFVQIWEWEILEHMPYSPDMSLFQKMASGWEHRVHSNCYTYQKQTQVVWYVFHRCGNMSKVAGDYIDGLKWNCSKSKLCWSEHCH